MSAQILFHGANGDNILNIIRDGSMRPDANHEIYFSATHEDTFAHGPDSKRKASFGFKAQVNLPAGASQRREWRSGNPLSVIVTSALPVPVELLELYVRPARGTTYETIRGVQAIKTFLSRP